MVLNLCPKCTIFHRSILTSVCVWGGWTPNCGYGAHMARSCILQLKLIWNNFNTHFNIKVTFILIDVFVPAPICKFIKFMEQISTQCRLCYLYCIVHFHRGSPAASNWNVHFLWCYIFATFARHILCARVKHKTESKYVRFLNVEREKKAKRKW